MTIISIAIIWLLFGVFGSAMILHNCNRTHGSELKNYQPSLIDLLVEIIIFVLFGPLTFIVGLSWYVYFERYKEYLKKRGI